MLDTKLDEHHAEFGLTVREDQRGVAYPAVFVLDRSGIVEQKRLEVNYRLRESAALLLDEALGIKPAAEVPEGTREQDAVSVGLRPDSPLYIPYQVTRLIVDVSIAPSYHLYCSPTPDAFHPLEVELELIPGLEPRGTVLPPPTGRPWVDELGGDFAVYEGNIPVVVRFDLAVPRGHGPVRIPVRIRFQACNKRFCMPPQSHLLEYALDEAVPTS